MKFFKFYFLTACCLLTTLSCFSQWISVQRYDWGIGLRLGDPTGITIKKHNDNRALELSFGSSHLFGRNDYWDSKYRDRFSNGNYCNNCKYLGYKRSIPIGVQFHYLFLKKIHEVKGSQALEWYYGFGAQLSFQTYYFKYKMNGVIYDTGDRTVDIDFGGDVVIGLEYLFPDVPFSVFLDLTLFIEVVDDPFVPWYMGGFGGRYNF